MARVVAVDLGSWAVKVTVLDGNGRSAKVIERYTQPVPQDDGLTVAPLGERIAVLADLVKQHPTLAGANAVAVTWPTEQATLHRVTLPFTDVGQVEKTLPYTVEAIVPFDLEDMVMPWRVLSVGTDTRVLVGLAKKEPLAVFLAALGKIGLDPRNVYLDAEVLGHFATDKARLTAVVDVGHAHTLVTVVRGGQVQWSRAINVGGRDFTKAIRDAVGCTWDEAEALKHGTPAPKPAIDFGNADPELGVPEHVDAYATLPKAAQDALDSPIGLLLAEVRSTLISAEDELGVEIEEVRLTGGGARLGPLPDDFTADLGVPVLPVSDVQGSPLPPEYALSEALASMVTGQSALQTFDLRIGELSYRGGTDMVRTGILFVGAAVAFLFVAIVGFSGYQFYKLSSALATTQADIDALMAQTVPDADPTTYADNTRAKALLKERMEDAKTRAAMLGAAGVPPTVDKLSALTTAFPPANQVVVDVSDLTITPDNISFTAETDGYAGSAAIEDALKRFDRFASATKGSEKKNKDKVQFTMSIPLGDTAKKEAGDGG